MLDQAAPSILVVDRHDGSLGAFGEHPTWLGGNVRRVDGVHAACALLRRQWFPVIVASLPAPGTDALALLRAAQRSLPRSEVVFQFEDFASGETALVAIRGAAAAVVDPGASPEVIHQLIEALLLRLQREAPATEQGAPKSVGRASDAVRLERQRAVLRPLGTLARIDGDEELQQFRLAIVRAARDATSARHAWVLVQRPGGDAVVAAEPVADEVPWALARETGMAARPLTTEVVTARGARLHLAVPVPGDAVRAAIVVELASDQVSQSEDVALLEALARELSAAEQLAALRREVREARDAVVLGLANALELRDRETSRHSHRVAEFARELALELGITADPALDELRVGALLHDIGKVGVPDAILRKPGPLADEEWIEMQRHPEYGWRILRDLPDFGGAAELVLVSHERWDGRGYPRGLAGDEIPLAARIFSVADAWDSMTSDRTYRRALPLDEALQEISDRAGTQFDPEVVEAFFRVTARRFRERRRPAA